MFNKMAIEKIDSSEYPRKSQDFSPKDVNQLILSGDNSLTTSQKIDQV